MHAGSSRCMILVSLSIIAASRRALPQRLALLRASVQESRRELSAESCPRRPRLRSPMRSRTQRCRARLPPAGIEVGADRSYRQLLPVLGTQSHFRDGGLHRARQPAADLPWRNRRRSLRLARIPHAHPRQRQQQRRAKKWRRPRTLPFSIRCDGTGEETYADGTPKRWWSKLAVVDDRREVAAAKRSSSTIRWSITECASIRPATAAPESSIT